MDGDDGPASMPGRRRGSATRIEVLAPEGVPEVGRGTDLVAMLLAALERAAVELADGDVLVVTSKAVSKAEGRVVSGGREQVVAAETQRVVAQRGATRIVRTRHGLTLAAAGVDASNVTPGSVAALPVDPDASARRLRDGVFECRGRNVGVVVTDTAGRAWREGQTDIAVGAAGLVVLDDHAGRRDGYGNLLAVTAPAVADEVAGAVELAQGKLAGRPVGVLRGRPDLVLPRGQHGPGAAALVRPEGSDLFGYGAREAVLRALRGDPTDAPPFGDPVVAAELATALDRLHGDARPGAGAGEQPGARVVDASQVRCTGDRATLAVLAFAHGWALDPPPAHTAGAGEHVLRPRPRTP